MKTDAIGKIKKTSILLLIIALSTLFTSCYPDDDLTAADTDVVVTFYKDGTDFSSKLKFALPDSVIHIDDEGKGVKEEGVYDQQILSRIKVNLTELGYTEVANPNDADVVINVAVTTSTWVAGGCYTWYDYWYPFPYCYPVAYTYSTGTIIIAMGDAQAHEETEVLWYAGLNGILEDTSAGIETRINKNIDQAFNQSDYLGK